MNNAALERRLLQAAVACGSLVPIAAGIAGMVSGGAFLRGVDAPVPVDLDSHFRYLSGLLLGIGLAFAGCIPRIERSTTKFRLLGIIVIAGGLGRLASLLIAGTPGTDHLAGLAMELGAMPLLIFWQGRVAREASRVGSGTAGRV